MAAALLSMPAAVLLLLVLAACSSRPVIKEVHVGLNNNNELQIKLDVVMAAPADVYAEYWQRGKEQHKYKTVPDRGTERAELVLANILPQAEYEYSITAVKGNDTLRSKAYTFKTHELPLFLQEQFTANAARGQQLPAAFNNGLMLINKRYAPGAAYLVDNRGRIRWYHTSSLGFKVINFTPQKTLLAIMGTNDEPTSYGSEILEVNLHGDTVLHLKKGQGTFKQTIHHEIIKNKKGQLVTIYSDKRVMDLSALGGAKRDTVVGDGILVMDNKGREVYRWSVFNVSDPLRDPKLLKSKKDWMHANSLSFDKDGNYLMSFYNNGQIWKINAQTGRVMYKLGKGGDISMPAGMEFSQAHAAHINRHGALMFFDNGTERGQSSVCAVSINAHEHRAAEAMYFMLPKQVYNGRMGSAYLIDDTHTLVCCSKRHIIVLADSKGALLWTMETAVPTYRAVFIPYGQLAPYLSDAE